MAGATSAGTPRVVIAAGLVLVLVLLLLVPRPGPAEPAPCPSHVPAEAGPQSAPVAVAPSPSQHFQAHGASTEHFLDQARLFSLLRQNQFPPDCSQARAFVWRPVTPSGLGSQLHLVSRELLHALCQGRTLVVDDSTSRYFNPRLCPSMSFACFLNFSGCTPETIGPVDGTRVVRSLPARPLCNLGLPTFNSSLWALGQAASFLFEPNEQLRRFTQQLRQNISLPARYISIHVRTTHVLKLEGIQHEPAEYLIYLKKLSRLHSCSAVFFSSDDPASLDYFVEQAPDLTFHSIPVTEFPSSGLIAPGESIEHFFVTQSGQLYQGDFLRDEGRAMLANIQLLGGGIHFIGTFSSNVGRWAFELMSRVQFPPPFVDLDNDLFFHGSTPRLSQEEKQRIQQGNKERLGYLHRTLA